MSNIIPIDVMDDITTNLSENNLIYYIDQSLNNTSEHQYVISEIGVDDEDIIYPDSTLKKWSIKFYVTDENDRDRYLRESQYTVPKYEIKILFTNCTKTLGYNIVEFEECCNVRSDICRYAISVIKEFIKKTEEELSGKHN